MSGFFQNLLARSRTDAGVVRPRIASRFEAPQVSAAAPFQEIAVMETSARPLQGASERQVAHSISSPASEPQTHADARPPSVEVQAVAELPRERQVSSKVVEGGIRSAPRQQPNFDPTPERTLSRAPSLASSATEESPTSPVTREIRETHDVHETIREQMTVIDRTFFERVALAGKQSPQARAAAQPAINAEPEIHVSIGRIEVRAVNDTPAARRTPPQSSPVMGLDEYLRQKNKGAAQ